MFTNCNRVSTTFNPMVLLEHIATMHCNMTMYILCGTSRLCVCVWINSLYKATVHTFDNTARWQLSYFDVINAL